jgi:hypothetical protein
MLTPHQHQHQHQQMKLPQPTASSDSTEIVISSSTPRSQGQGEHRASPCARARARAVPIAEGGAGSSEGPSRIGGQTRNPEGSRSNSACPADDGRESCLCLHRESCCRVCCLPALRSLCLRSSGYPSVDRAACHSRESGVAPVLVMFPGVVRPLAGWDTVSSTCQSAAATSQPKRRQRRQSRQAVKGRGVTSEKDHGRSVATGDTTNERIPGK